MNSNITKNSAAPRRRGLNLIAAIAAFCALLALSAASAGAFEIVKVDGATTGPPTEANPAGETETQAGAHPFRFTTEIQFSEVTNEGGQKIPDGNFKNLKAQLPPGLIGNPNAIRKCTLAEFQEMEFAGENGRCPNEAAIGVASVLETSEVSQIAPVYNLQPNPGEPALFGFHIATTSVFLHPNARTGGDYGITVSFSDLSQALPLVGTTLTLWGVPADELHDTERGFFREQAGAAFRSEEHTSELQSHA